MMHGVWTALPDLWSSTQGKRLERAVSNLLGRGIAGLFVLGTTGRGTDFPLQQRMKALEHIMSIAGDSSRIIVAISANSPDDVRVLLEHATSLNVKGVALTPPFYGTWTKDELLGWVNAVFDGVERTPEVYLYHIPSAVRTGWDPEILTEVERRVAIAGLKDSSGDVGQLSAYLAWARGRSCSVMVGNERLTSYCLMLGGSGVVSGLSAAYPTLMLQAYIACRSKDWDAAAAAQRAINEKLDQLACFSPRRVQEILIEIAQAEGVL